MDEYRPPRQSRVALVVAGCVVFFLIAAGLGASWWFFLRAERGRNLDASSREFATEVVRAVTATWTAEPLQVHATSEFRAVLTGENLQRTLEVYRTLGTVQRLDAPVGGARSSAGIGAVQKDATAEYTFPATFSSGPATVRIALVLVDDVWKVNGFWIHSPGGRGRHRFSIVLGRRK